jgi:DNA-binding NarL/FixJ family response regulator
MSANHSSRSTRIGLFTNEPIRLEGLTTIFERKVRAVEPPLTPVSGSAEQMLGDLSLKYLLVDLNSACSSLKTLEFIRNIRPDVRLIVIGPHADELVLESITAGARAYLDSTAAPELVRQAIEVVISGSIWAPRRLLSQLIDRLLAVPDSSVSSSSPRLTGREREVLDLILTARSNREIARELGIEERTVKAHVGRLMRKTGADNRIGLSVRALNHSLLPLEGTLQGQGQ